MRAAYDHPILTLSSRNAANPPPMLSPESVDLSPPIQFAPRSFVFGYPILRPEDSEYEMLQKKLKLEANNHSNPYLNSLPLVKKQVFDFNPDHLYNSLARNNAIYHQRSYNAPYNGWFQQQYPQTFNMQSFQMQNPSFTYEQNSDTSALNYLYGKNSMDSFKLNSSPSQYETQTPLLNVTINDDTNKKNNNSIKIPSPKSVPRDSDRKQTKKSKEEGNEPAMAEFSKMFPEWNLRTIFDFLRSNKSKEEFEVWRKERMAMKSRAAKYRNRNKTQQVEPTKNE